MHFLNPLAWMDILRYIPPCFNLVADSGDAVLKRGHLPVSDAVLKSGHSLDATYLPRPDAEIEILTEVSQRLRTTANRNGFLTAPLEMGALLTLPDFTAVSYTHLTLPTILLV